MANLTVVGLTDTFTLTPNASVIFSRGSRGQAYLNEPQLPNVIDSNLDEPTLEDLTLAYRRLITILQPVLLNNAVGTVNAGGGGLPIRDSTGRIIVDQNGLHVFDTLGVQIVDANVVQIDTTHLVDASVTTQKIANLSVDTAKLATLSVEAEKLATGAVIAGKIAVNTIVAGDGVIANAAIGTALIANASITTALIGNLQVVNAKIADLAITDAKINDLSANKINVGTLSADRIASNSITAAKIAALTITAAEIASLAITGAKIAAGTITASNIASNTLTAGVIAASAIGTSELAANAVTAIKINVATLSAIAANIGTITAGTISGISLSGNTITGGTININSGTFEVNATGTVFADNVIGGVLRGDNASISTSAGVIAQSSQAHEGLDALAVTGNTSSEAHGVRGQNINDSTSGLVGAANSFDFFADGSGTDYGPFTGGHEALLKHIDVAGLKLGDIMVDKELIHKRGMSNTIFRIERSTMAQEEGVIGVLAHITRKLKDQVPAALNNGREVFFDPIDGKTRTKGKVSKKYTQIKALYTNSIVNALGEGQINVCGEGGDLAIGDLIITSNSAGKGMKQADNILRSHTVAKTREAVSFVSSTQVKMIACIYLCG